MVDFPEFEAAAFWQEPDFILTDLVSLMANRMNAELGITLMVRGTIMTGTLIGERDYLAAVSKMFKRITRDMLDKPTAEDIQSIEEAFAFDDLAEDFYPPGDPEETGLPDILPMDELPIASAISEAAAGLPPIRFLHLKDPVIVSPGSSMAFRDSALPIMRIRLNQIEGWMLGRVMMMTSDDYPAYDDDDENEAPPSRYSRGGFVQ